MQLWGSFPLLVSEPQSQYPSEKWCWVRICKPGILLGRGCRGFHVNGEFLGCIMPSRVPCADWHVDSPRRCHVPVAGHALLAVADADGLIGLFQLLGSKVSGWDGRPRGWREPDGEGLGGASPWGSLSAGKSRTQRSKAATAHFKVLGSASHSERRSLMGHRSRAEVTAYLSMDLKGLL